MIFNIEKHTEGLEIDKTNWNKSDCVIWESVGFHWPKIRPEKCHWFKLKINRVLKWPITSNRWKFEWKIFNGKEVVLMSRLFETSGGFLFSKFKNLPIFWIWKQSWEQQGIILLIFMTNRNFILKEETDTLGQNRSNINIVDLWRIKFFQIFFTSRGLFDQWRPWMIIPNA